MRRLLANPIFTVLRTGNHTALVLFPDGQHYVFLSAGVDAAIQRLGPAVALSHTLPYSNGIPEHVIWVKSDSDEGDAPAPHESSSVAPRTLPIPTRIQSISCVYLHISDAIISCGPIIPAAASLVYTTQI